MDKDSKINSSRLQKSKIFDSAQEPEHVLCFSAGFLRLWNVCPACGEWWNIDIKICPDCKESGKNVELIAKCANCGKTVNECECEYKLN